MNPFRITKAEEHVDGFEDRALRGALKSMTWEWRISMNDSGWVLLWLIVGDQWNERDDYNPAWMCAASWRPEMPIVEDCVRRIAFMFFEGGCKELMQADIADDCFEMTWGEARDKDAEWDRVRAYQLTMALGA